MKTGPNSDSLSARGADTTISTLASPPPAGIYQYSGLYQWKGSLWGFIKVSLLVNPDGKMHGWEKFYKAMSTERSRVFLRGSITKEPLDLDLTLPRPSNSSGHGEWDATLSLKQSIENGMTSITGYLHHRDKYWDVPRTQTYTAGRAITQHADLAVGYGMVSGHGAATKWPYDERAMHITPLSAGDPHSPLKLSIGADWLLGEMTPTHGAPGWYTVTMRVKRYSVQPQNGIRAGREIKGEIKGECFVTEDKDHKLMLMLTGQSGDSSLALVASARH
jgi:hypothetical protein